MVADVVRVGLIGCGRFGAVLLEGLCGLNDQARTATSADLDLDSPQVTVEEVWASVAVDDHRKLIAHVDAVAVTEPNHSHHQIGPEWSETGKHLFMYISHCPSATESA